MCLTAVKKGLIPCGHPMVAAQNSQLAEPHQHGRHGLQTLSALFTDDTDTYDDTKEWQADTQNTLLE